jgi:hypothetical protein
MLLVDTGAKEHIIQCLPTLGAPVIRVPGQPLGDVSRCGGRSDAHQRARRPGSVLRAHPSPPGAPRLACWPPAIGERPWPSMAGVSGRRNGRPVDSWSSCSAPAGSRVPRCASGDRDTGSSAANRGHAHHQATGRYRARAGRPRRFGGVQRGGGTCNARRSWTVRRCAVLPAAMAGVVIRPWRPSLAGGGQTWTTGPIRSIPGCRVRGRRASDRQRRDSSGGHSRALLARSRPPRGHGALVAPQGRHDRWQRTALGEPRPDQGHRRRRGAPAGEDTPVWAVKGLWHCVPRTRVSVRAWGPRVPWPVWPLAGQSRVGQPTRVGSLMMRLSWRCWGAGHEGVGLDPDVHCTRTVQRLSAVLPERVSRTILRLPYRS